MTERAIDWAGNPDKDKLTAGEGVADRLTPRGSFEVWREIVRGQSLPWQRWEIEGGSSLRRLLLGGVRRRASELHGLNNRLLDADRAKNEFIANVSHELRTPLHAIAGWTQVLRKGSTTPELSEKALDVIARNVDTQAQLIEDLLDLSRVATGKLRLEVDRVDLALLVESTIQSLQLSATAKTVRIAPVLEAEGTTVLGDALRIRQVITNLLTNAIKFTPREGSIHVALRRRESDVELSVTDSGQGITPEFLPHVFDIFRQEDAGMNRRSHGLGLGLAIVKKLVEMHGGRVWAESDGVGRGASFFVRLPISASSRPEAVSEPAPASPTVAPPVLAGLHVLVVEDEQDSRDLIQHILEEAKMVVTAVADAAEALNVLGSIDREFDLVVSDIGLPVVDGISFMRAVRQRPAGGGGSLPAVALTAHTRAVDRTRVLQAGFNAHVPKPVDPDEFLAVLMSVARRNG
jgi:signal transduction histidine kinase